MFLSNVLFNMMKFSLRGFGILLTGALLLCLGGVVLGGGIGPLLIGLGIVVRFSEILFLWGMFELIMLLFQTFMVRAMNA